MRSITTRALAALLAAIMTLGGGGFVSCANNDETIGGDGTKATGASNEAETIDPAQAALDAIPDVDYHGETFTILSSDSYKSETYAQGISVGGEEESTDSVINDAVYERNTKLSEMCKLEFNVEFADDTTVNTRVRTESQAPTGDFKLIYLRARDTATNATSGYLYNYLDLDIDLDQPWWDRGTADFALDGNIFFMNGAHNFDDDNKTYVMLFNKEMQQKYENTVPNPYETVRTGEWTLEYFNQAIQGISSDSSGDGKMNELDTYGFITTWEYGNTFFTGAGLRYVANSRDAEEPTLFLSDASRMEKALNVLSLAQAIYHSRNATFMSPAGKEPQGLDAFKENRGLFYGEIAAYLAKLNKEMDGIYGVLPVPKYDKEQENYLTWTHDAGSTMSITSAVTDSEKETLANIIETYVILSYQKVKPAFYDITLTSKSIKDPDSAEMLDIIFANRSYDMAMYYATQLGFYELFKNAVNNNSGSFSSTYKSVASGFDRNMDTIMRSLRK